MTDDHAPRASRRDFVARAAMAFACAGSALAAWPILAQMGPNRATPSPGSVDVDLQGIQPGSTKVVRWRGMPVFVRHRTPQEVQEARATALTDLPDRLARNAMLPQTALAVDANRTKEGHEAWLVVTGLCTHLGCVLSGTQRLRRAKPGSVRVMRLASTCQAASAPAPRAPIYRCRAMSSDAGTN